MQLESFDLKTVKDEFPNAYASDVIYSFTVKKIGNECYRVSIIFDDDRETIDYPLKDKNIVNKLVEELTVCAIEGVIDGV